MTQNLDLNLEALTTLTSYDTDLPDHSLTGAYQDGYTYDATPTTPTDSPITSIATWTPVRSTIDAVTTEDTSIITIEGWQNSNAGPYSVDPGDWYWSGTYYPSSLCYSEVNRYRACDYMSKIDPTYATYFSTTPYTGAGTSNNGTHGHAGNYYNWSNAIASNNSSGSATSTYDNPAQNPQNSVCPVGWRLPIITAYTSGSLGANDFYNLAYHYNSNNIFNDSWLIASPLFFTRAGGPYDSVLMGAGFNGRYWSSTVLSGAHSYAFDLGSGTVNITYHDVRWNSKTLRCLAR